jgi:hypothetical protein
VDAVSGWAGEGRVVITDDDREDAPPDEIALVKLTDQQKALIAKDLTAFFDEEQFASIMSAECNHNG